LSSRQHQKKIITDIEIGDNKISSVLEMAEAFNCHFANMRHDLANDIPPTVKEPEYYLNPTNKTFSLNSCSTSEVQKLLENLEVKKAPCLDNLPPKLLKLAARILPPSLTFLFNQLLSSGIAPLEWKLARVTPIFKRAKGKISIIIGQSQLFLLSLRFSKE